ncbi:hypothetical protein FACS189445_1560 [Spirochaetia bacterium]|nr:hypothetical protein FACS189445_1560 [Spirochaetia bacterium]
MKNFSGRIQGTDLILFIGVLILLHSCNVLTGTTGQENKDPPEVPEKIRDFYVYNFDIRSYYTLNAVQLIENEGCVIYGDLAWQKRITKAEEQKIREAAEEYETTIYPKISGVFGECTDIDGNGKLIILLLDIIDGISPGSGSYMAGYFDSSDMGPGPYSNRGELLYMDIAEGVLGSEDFHAAIAHEFQHLLRYSAYMRTGAYTETWLDEGLSGAAEYVYLGKHLDDSVRYYNLDPENKIARGNTFFYWQGSDPADYATAYLFFQWLRIQAAGPDDPQGFRLYREICASPNSQGVVNAAVKLIRPDLDSWDKLIRTWLTANYMNSPRKNAADGLGLYGYNNEFTLMIHPYPKTGAAALLPGEGVYSVLPENGSFSLSGASGSHIGYGDIRKGQPPLFNPVSKNYSGEYLLTYNGNDNNSTGTGFLKESGQITGVTPVLRPSPPRAVSGPSSPMRIDGTSLLPKQGR